MEILSLLDSLNIGLSDVIDWGLEAGKVIVKGSAEGVGIKGLPESEMPEVKRLLDAVNLLVEPVSTLSKLEKQQPGLLPLSVNKALRELTFSVVDLQKLLRSDPKEASLVMKSRGYSSLKLGEALKGFREELTHGVRLMTLAVKMAHYTNTVKEKSLTKLISDQIARNSWRDMFGDSKSEVDFESVCNLLDDIFSRYGERAFAGECSSESFFSFYRNEGAWIKCKDCREKLRERLSDLTLDPTGKMVSVVSFAKFCGDNCLNAVKGVIISAHPSKDTRIIDPRLHMDLVSKDEVKEPMSKNCRILFVGNSDMLAEVHYNTCKSTGPLIDFGIDSVPDFASFKTWYDANDSLLSDKSARVVIVSSCQKASCVDCGEARSESKVTIAEKVHEILVQDFRENVGFAIACCPFLTHGPEQMHTFKRALSSSILKFITMSCDGKRLAGFIHEAFSGVLESSSKSGVAVGSSKTWSAGDTPAEGTLEAKGNLVTGKSKTGKFAKFKDEKGKKSKAT